MEKDVISTPLTTSYGKFDFWVWDEVRGQERIALSTPNLDPSKKVILRMHSECITGDVFGSLACDCGEQKEAALREIEQSGNGIFIYQRQEGRNAGLFKKIQIYNLSFQDLDHHEASILLTGNPDARDFKDALEVLKFLLRGRKSEILLLSNNPYKRLILEREGYIVKIKPLVVGQNIYNENYFKIKKLKFLHFSPTFLPYAGITLTNEVIKEQGVKLSAILNSLDIYTSGRKLMIGIGIDPEIGDLKNSSIALNLNKFAEYFKSNNGFSLVLHMEYSNDRKFYRNLKNFLAFLNFNYSVQFRFAQDKELPKLDFELLESLRSFNIIFQIKKKQFSLFDNQKFVELVRRTNTYLLLDESWGTGTHENLSSLKAVIMEVIKRGISHVGVAGGFYSGNVREIRELEDYFKIPISVDAESKLHKNGKLDMAELFAYLSFFFKK